MDFALALAIALVATPIASALARRLGVVDHPGPLKVHARPVPYLGGAAVFAAMAAVLAPSAPRLLLPLGLALAVGTIDDLRPQPAVTRILCELGVGAAAGWAAPVPGPVGGLVTAVATIGLLNAVNLLDGLDGLAAGAATVSAGGFALLDGSARTPALALAGALLGFLAFNRPPARIYLGDGGAYLVGTALVLLGSLAIVSEPGVATWAAVPLFVAVPVIDTAVAFARRIRAGHPLFVGDRSHVYDQLVDRGHPPVAVVGLMVVTQVVLAGLGLVVTGVEAPWAIVVTIAVAAAVAGIVGAQGFVRTSGGPSGAS